MSSKDVPEVKIGKLPYQSYVVAIVKCFKNNKTVKVMARGRNIGKGVIASNVAVRSLDGISYGSIDIFDTEHNFTPEGSDKPVSRTLTNITISLTKKA